MLSPLNASFPTPQADPRPAPLLAPDLLTALTELATSEDLPVGALIALLINEALDRRLHGGRS